MDLNQGPRRYERPALTAELRAPETSLLFRTDHHLRQPGLFAVRVVGVDQMLFGGGVDDFISLGERRRSLALFPLFHQRHELLEGVLEFASALIVAQTSGDGLSQLFLGGTNDRHARDELRNMKYE